MLPQALLYPKLDDIFAYIETTVFTINALQSPGQSLNMHHIDFK